MGFPFSNFTQAESDAEMPGLEEEIHFPNPKPRFLDSENRFLKPEPHFPPRENHFPDTDSHYSPTKHAFRPSDAVFDFSLSPQENVSDSDCTLSGLPSGKTVRVRIVAANEAGEAAPSAVMEIAVP
jgi:hypothetical protein